MARTIQQSVEFAATPGQLYSTYLDSKKHGAVIGSKASINPKVGGRFSAFDGGLSGKILHLVRNEAIIQTWRSAGWSKKTPDSVLILTFSKTQKGAQVNMVHANVPDKDVGGVQKGWNNFYWKPWQASLKPGEKKAGVAAKGKKAAAKPKPKAKPARKPAPRLARRS